MKDLFKSFRDFPKEKSFPVDMSVCTVLSLKHAVFAFKS